MAPDSRHALLLHIEAEALLIAARSRALRDALHDGQTLPDGKVQGLCAWLYRLACEVAMLQGLSRPRIDLRIEAEALKASSDQVARWRAVEAAKSLVRWVVGQR